MHQASSIGGGTYCLLNILKVIDRTQIEPIVCLVSDGPLRVEIEKINIETLIFPQMSSIPYNRSLLRLSSIVTYIRVQKSQNLFRKLLVDTRIDMVYLNNMMIYPYLRVAKECGCKTILHCREHWPLDEHKHQLQWARNAVYQYADELIAINTYSASVFPDKKSTVIYDWIDMDSRFELCPLSEIFNENMSDKKVFLYTGGVQRIKGAVEVISSFSKCIKDNRSRLLVIGVDLQREIGFLKKCLYFLGVKSYYCKVRDLINKDQRIICIPATYMLGHIMQQCYCNLSYFKIPHANLALAECAIMGTPSIAADNEEAREYSLNGKLSYLYTANSLVDFEKALSSFDSSIAMFRRNLLNYSGEIQSKFSRDLNAKHLNMVISSLLLS